MNPRRWAAEERAELAAFLDGLTAAQWDAPTLCPPWRVRDVVAHMISYEDLGARGLLRRFAQGRFRLSRVNDVGVAAYATCGPRELVALLDATVHHQDIRRPLGAPREIPAERLRPALDFALVAPPIGAFRRVRGLRLVATDMDWASGRGPEVRGPAEAVLMAAAGRRGVVRELTGPGRDTLAARIGD